MARSIMISEENIKVTFREFVEYLRSAKMKNGQITFTKTLGSVERRAELHFSEKAWIKMQSLIKEFDKEVAWHGTMFRDADPEKDAYYITDIFVYPQEVSGATVTTDQEKYQTWLYGLDDDVFNNLRMQGHSHVNMSTSPSGVDIAYYDSIIEQLEDDMFYAFLIWNKKGERTAKIYDMQKNILFESADIDIVIDDPVIDLDNFLSDAKKLVVTKTYSYSYAGNCGTKPALSTVIGKTTSDTKTCAATTSAEKKQGKKKAKRKMTCDNPPVSASYQGFTEDGYENITYYRDGYYDDYSDDPYSAFGYKGV